MPYVTKVKLGKRSLPVQWQQLEESIKRLNELTLTDPTTGISMCGVNDSLMGIAYSPNLGFYVSSMVEEDMNEKVLMDAAAANEIVEATIGGQGNFEHRCLLVPEGMAIEAAREFFFSGRRASNLRWIGPTELGPVE